MFNSRGGFVLATQSHGLLLKSESGNVPTPQYGCRHYTISTRVYLQTIKKQKRELSKALSNIHGGPADPFGGTPGGTPKRGTPQGRVPHRVGSAGGTPSRGLPQGVPHRVG